MHQRPSIYQRPFPCREQLWHSHLVQNRKILGANRGLWLEEGSDVEDRHT